MSKLQSNIGCSLEMVDSEVDRFSFKERRFQFSNSSAVDDAVSFAYCSVYSQNCEMIMELGPRPSWSPEVQYSHADRVLNR